MIKWIRRIIRTCEHSFKYVISFEEVFDRKKQGHNSSKYSWKIKGGTRYAMVATVIYRKCRKCKYKKEIKEFYGDNRYEQAEQFLKELK